ncbi:hypothetical protein FE783_24510 [Paenibacillus mesophilus]|uniref:S-layer homology domain-containing protein n=1 Tax=Paenibacillus mesophilus TaxID=2582849 RepID=UPI00110F63E7|nr:S-layer homology domain-containing protein [Paenibacillus mesophilus]TMV46806.1 hypothetical protein FE783_24510 [Paenibacillus mesophilus]
MNRFGRKVWKQAIAVLSAITLLLPELGVVSAAKTEERDVFGKLVANAVMNAVYGVKSGNPSGQAVGTPGVPLSWNHLTKLDRNLVPAIYQPDQQELNLSGDGRYVAYKRMDVTLNPVQVYPVIAVYDRVTGATDTIKFPDAAQTDDMLHYDMSSDARYVAFSYASGLIDRTTRVYLFDRVSRELKAITSITGTADSDDSDRVSISAEGQYVAFDSNAKGLVPEDTNDYRDVFVYNRENGSLARISARAGMEEDDYGDSEAPSISADGRYVAFHTYASLADDDGGQRDIYVYDRQKSSGAPFERVSVGMSGAEANGESVLPSISADGQVIAYESDADNLVAGDLNGKKDIFVYNRTTAATALVSRGPGGLPFNRDSLHPSISDDGHYVGFHLDYAWVSDTDNDPGNDKENDIPEEAYVADVAAQTAYRVTAGMSPYRLVNPSLSPVVGDGGKLVVYSSEYIENFGGMAEDLQLPGIFIAAQGAAPVWPAGGKLEAANRTADSVRLVWTDATDATGILGYHVYQDGRNIGYVPFGSSGGNTYIAAGLLPGAEPVFQIEAVNTAYLESYGGPTYKLGKGGGENPAGDLRLTWDIDDMRNGMAIPGSKLSVTAYGEPGKRVTAELEYAVWKDDVSQETRKTPLTLAERAASPGTYDAQWRLAEGVSQIVSLNVLLTDPAKPGTVQEKPAQGFPIQAAGIVELAFQNADGVNLAGSVLSMLNSQYGEQVSVLTGSGSFTISGMYPGEDYSLVLRSPDFRHTWGTLGQVQAVAGKRKVVSMQIEQPAKIRFQLLNPTGMPAYGVRLELFDLKQEFIDSFYIGADGWSGWLDNMKAGETVVAKFDIGEMLMEPVPSQKIELKPGPNEEVIRLKAPGEGILQGYVKSQNGQVVPNALVTSVQTYRGQQVVRKARTNLEGAYRMSLLKGEAMIEVYESSYEYSTNGGIAAQVTEGQTTEMDIPVYQPNRGVVNLEVRLKYLEDTDFGEPVNMEQMGFYTRVQSKTGWMSGYFHNAYHFQGAPGDPVSVCVTGTIPAYMTSCTEVTLDSNANATAKLYLEEKGARIQGKLSEVSRGTVSGALYKLMDKGYRSSSSAYIGENDFTPDGAFSINVPEAGSYVMELTRRLEGSPVRYEYATVQFTVADKQILPIGTVSFSGKKVFSPYNGNYYDAMNSRIAPGATVSFRAGYKNGGESDANDAKLLVDIPEGTAPVKDAAGRIVVTGLPAAGEAVLDGRTLIIPIGTIAKKQSGTIGFQIKADPAFNKSEVKSSARIHAMIGGVQVEETIGSVLLDAPLVTLEAPDRVFGPTLELSGIAPKQSAVKVYDGNELLGSAAASSTGFWTLRVELPDLGDPGTHAIRAETESNGVKLQSPVSYVSYDTKKPRLLEMAMAQAPEGKWVTMDIRQGISNPPYTVVPGNPFQFELKFDKPDKVDNVYIYLDGQAGEPVKAVRDGGIFRALTPTNKGALGDIYVDYDTKPEPIELSGKFPAMDEVRASLPLTMRDFKVEVVSPFELKNGTYSGTVKMTFPQLDNMTVTVTLALEPNVRYSATAEEIGQVERSGVPMYNSSFGLTETEDGFKSVSKGYMPMSVLFPQGVPTELKGSQSSREVTALDADPAFAAVVTESYVQFGPGGSEFGTFNSIKSQYDGMTGFAGKINKITYKVQASGLDCLAELPRTVKQAGKATVALVGGEVAKFGLGVWTAAMGLSGAGAVAAAGTSAVVGAKIDNYVDEQIDQIGTGYNQCLNEDVDSKKRKRYKIARPRWIYDPSGYVYEAVPENRLSDVKATVLYQDPVGKEWTVWDARPYGQVNPHPTDDQGKYGWDVPEGKWKVVWEKAGYATVTSAELDVPPPHTEVNAGMVSWEAPKVLTVTGVTYSGGSHVDIGLSKYVKATASALSERAVTVTGADGRTVEGALAFVQPTDNPADPGGEKLSRVVRFTPKAALSAGDGNRVKVSAGYFQSYSGAWMNEGYAGAFPVSVRDERGPEAVNASVEAEGMIVRLTFDEKVALVDSSKFALNGSGDLIASAVKALGASEDRTILLTLSEPLATNSSGQLTVGTGAVFDAAGNGSVQKLLQVARTVSTSEAQLASLTVEEGVLSPAFHPSTLAYTVAVPPTAEQLHVTATVYDPRARLIIDGAEAVSSKPKAVMIPDNGNIAVRVTAPDGAAVREYSIRINRTTTPGSTSGWPVEPILTKVESFTGSNGGSGLRVTLQSDAIAKALETNTDGKKQLTVEVEKQADEYVLLLPANARDELNKHKAEIIFRTTMLQVLLPAAVFQKVELPAGASLQIGFGAMSDTEEKAALEAAARQSGNALKPAGKPVHVRLEAVIGQEVSAFTLGSAYPMIVELPVNSARQEAVYRLDGTGNRWTYAWSQSNASHNGRSAIEVLSTGTLAALAYANPFTDTVGHWAAEDLDWMGRRLLVNGVAPGSFKPDQPVTRAEFSTLLVRALGLNASSEAAIHHRFADVRKEAWYYDDVGAAAEAGLIDGVAPDRFEPDALMTREQMAVMIWRAYTYLHAVKGREAKPDQLHRFVDRESISEWAAQAIALSYESGLIQGTDTGAFDPHGKATRAQTAVIVKRLLQSTK